MHRIRITNSAQQDTTIGMLGTKSIPAPSLGLPDGAEVQFRRFLSTTNSGTDEELTAEHGDEYGLSLVAGDPEVDIEQVGRFIGATDTVFLSAQGEILHASPSVVEVVSAPDGSEKERRVPQDIPANVTGESIVRWTGKKVPLGVAIRRFAFKRTVALRHTDGLTHGYLHAIAKELSEENVMVLMGGGEDGKEPLVLQANGTPYRAFLEGRVDGERYKLLLHLSNLELKRPTEAP
jgi:hypothetical protein